MGDVSEIVIPFTLTEDDIYTIFKTWFSEWNENSDEFLDLEEDFNEKDGADKYAFGAVRAFVKYLNQIKGE